MARRRRNAALVLLGIALGFGLLAWLLGEESGRVARPAAPRIASEQRAPRRAAALPLTARPGPDAPPEGTEAEVAPEPLVAPDEVLVHIRLSRADGRPEPDARIRPGCEGARLISRDGADLVVAVPPGSCLLEGLRADGLLAARAEAIEIRGEPGDEIDVELVFPAERTGGIGIGIREVPEGVLVTYVHPGSPADDAGLREGDVIVEVDGLATTALDLPDFVSVMTGPEDTPVSFVLAGESDTGTFEEELELVRAYLPDERDS